MRPEGARVRRTWIGRRSFGDVDANALGVEPSSVDPFVCRRGPTLEKWLDLAWCVGRPGATAIGMHPNGAAGAVPPWNAELPEPLQVGRVFAYDDVRSWLTRGISRAPDRVRLDGCWWLDVAETFDDPAELYARLSGHRPEADNSFWPEVEGQLAKLFTAHGGSVELRHCRLVWRVTFH